MEHHVKATWFHYGLIPLTLAIITFILYAPSWHFAFQFDDLANISQHFQIRHHTLQSLFLSGTRWISFLINAVHYHFNKFDPFTYRVMSTTIHAVNGIFIFYLLNMLFSRAKQNTTIYHHAYALALVSTILFLFHPVQTQTVSYVIQAELEGLATMMILIQAMSFIIMSTTTQRITRIISFIMLMSAAFLSTGTKEIAIISPLLILMIDWFFIAQGEWHALKKRLLIHLFLFTVIFGMYLYLLKPSFIFPALTMQTTMRNSIGNAITKNPFDSITSSHFFISQFKVIVHYIFIFIWPFNISADYDAKLVDSFFAPDCIIPLLILFALGIMVARLLFKSTIHPISFAALWFAISIAPRSTIIPSRELMCDYKTYLGSLGLFVIIAYALIVGLHAFKKRMPILLKHPYTNYVATLMLLAPLTLLTFKRNDVWSNGSAFWLDVIAHAPGKSRGYNNYGVELTQQKQYAQAIPYFKKAIALDPYYSDPRNNLAVAAALCGDMDSAMKATTQSIKLDANHAEAHNNLASVFIEKGQFDEAHKLLDQANAIRPHYGKPYFNRGRIYLAQGQLDKAYEQFKIACTKADMDTAVGFGAFGKICCARGNFDEGIEYLQKSLALDNTREDFKRSLADAYAYIKKAPEAIELYKDLLRTNAHDKEIIHNIGQVYLKNKEYENAAQWLEKGKREIDPLPQTILSLAACYEKMGNALQSYFLLKQVADNEKADHLLRDQTRMMMARMEHHYPILKQNG